jgi:hypothetical protein
VSPVKYELGFYTPEDGILLSHCRENLKSYPCEMLLLIISDVSPIHMDAIIDMS